MKINLLLLPLLLNLFFASESTTICGGKLNEYCIKCFSGLNSNICELYKDKYFQIFNRLSFVLRNNSIYGQIGCKGKCDGSNYAQT